MQILCKSLTSVIGSAGFGWSGDSCFFVGDTGIFCVTGVAKPVQIKDNNNVLKMDTIYSQLKKVLTIFEFTIQYNVVH